MKEVPRNPHHDSIQSKNRYGVRQKTKSNVVTSNKHYRYQVDSPRYAWDNWTSSGVVCLGNDISLHT